MAGAEVTKSVMTWPASARSTPSAPKGRGSSPSRPRVHMADATRPPVLPPRQRSLGASPSSMARYQNASVACRRERAATEPRLSILSTTGTVYESVVVVGHMCGSDKVVYYLLEVRSWELPLEGYVVRRRYNDFRKFHSQLAKLMPTQRPRSNTSADFGLYYSSLLCNPLAQSTPESSPLWSPRRTEDDRAPHSRKHSATAISEDSSTSQQQLDENQERVSAPAVISVERKPPAGASSYNSDAVLPMETVKFNLAGRPWLPPLPSGGMTTLFTTRRALVNYRIEQFNHILAAVMSDQSSDVAALLMDFIQEKPDAKAQTYTSLSEYAPMEIPINVERHARRRAMSVGKRQLREQTSMPAA